MKIKFTIKFYFLQIINGNFLLIQKFHQYALAYNHKLYTIIDHYKSINFTKFDEVPSFFTIFQHFFIYFSIFLLYYYD